MLKVFLSEKFINFPDNKDNNKLQKKGLTIEIIAFQLPLFHLIDWFNANPFSTYLILFLHCKVSLFSIVYLPSISPRHYITKQ